MEDTNRGGFFEAHALRFKNSVFHPRAYQQILMILLSRSAVLGMMALILIQPAATLLWRLLSLSSHTAPVVIEAKLQPGFEIDLRLPSQQFLRLGDIRAALCRIILGQLTIDNLAV